jgi:hypothetical protein
MKFRLEIECDNAAFDENPGAEIANILRGVADRVCGGLVCPTMRGARDSNGNHVCAFSFTATDEQERGFWSAAAAEG